MSRVAVLRLLSLVVEFDAGMGASWRRATCVI